MSRWTLTRVFLRSFLFQAVFNYERMQNVGFAYAMTPALKTLYSGEALSAALKRHLKIFNSHPYMSAFTLGAALNMEEQIARGELPPESVEGMKSAMMTALAAVGDNFFWSSLRPTVAVWAVVLMLAEVYWAPLFFLVIYNSIHLTIRSHAFLSGYKHGTHSVQNLEKMRLPHFAQLAQRTSAVGMAFFAVLFTHKAYLSEHRFEFPLGVLFFFATTFIFILSLKRKMPIPLIIGVVTVLLLMFVSVLNKVFPLI